LCFKVLLERVQLVIVPPFEGGELGLLGGPNRLEELFQFLDGFEGGSSGFLQGRFSGGVDHIGRLFHLSFLRLRQGGHVIERGLQLGFRLLINQLHGPGCFINPLLMRQCRAVMALAEQPHFIHGILKEGCLFVIRFEKFLIRAPHTVLRPAHLRDGAPIEPGRQHPSHHHKRNDQLHGLDCAGLQNTLRQLLSGQAALGG
jgi:hypothetical protein